MLTFKEIVISYLSRSSGYQWLAFMPLFFSLLSLSIIEQYAAFSEKTTKIEQQIFTQQRKNLVLHNKLNAIQKSALPQSSVLSNDQIADKLQSWISKTNAEIVSLDFSEELYDSKLSITTVKGDFLLNVKSLYQLLNEELGDNLFIESLSIRAYDMERMKLLLQLLQPKPATQ